MEESNTIGKLANEYMREAVDKTKALTDEYRKHRANVDKHEDLIKSVPKLEEQITQLELDKIKLTKRVESYQRKYETPGHEQLCELCSTEVNERKRKRSENKKTSGGCSKVTKTFIMIK